MLPEETREEVVFFGGKNYVPLFCDLTATIKSRRTVFYNSARAPEASRCVLRRFDTTRKTNWHYGFANVFLDGDIRLGIGD